MPKTTSGTTSIPVAALFGVLLWAAVQVPASGSESQNPNRPKTTLMMCDFSRKAVTITVGEYRPKRCTGLRADQGFAEGFNYAKLRWLSWGRNEAYFRGVSLGFKLPFAKIKVQGRIDRPRRDRCGSSAIVFTRMKYRTRFGTAVRYLEPCLGRSG